MRPFAILAVVINLNCLAQTPLPSSAEQSDLIGEIRGKALDYNRALPDFICTQETHRYTASGIRGDQLASWKLSDTLTIELSYFGQKENYRLVAIDGKPSGKQIGKIGGTTSKGDFGSMLRAVFEAKSSAAFAVERPDTLRGRAVDVFSWEIDFDHSTFTASNAVLMLRRTTKWAGKGLLFVDAGTMEVLRLTVDSVGIPADFPMKSVQFVIDYDQATIGDKQYLLPLRSVNIVVYANGHTAKSDTLFTNYRKFTADANIRFDPPPQN